jgi:hypothetical protein
VNKERLHLLVEKPGLRAEVDLFDVRAVEGYAYDNVVVLCVKKITSEVNDANVGAPGD